MQARPWAKAGEPGAADPAPEGGVVEEGDQGL